MHFGVALPFVDGGHGSHRIDGRVDLGSDWGGIMAWGYSVCFQLAVIQGWGGGGDGVQLGGWRQWGSWFM